MNPDSEHDSSVLGFALSIALMLAILAFAFCTQDCHAAIVHTEGPLTITTETTWGLMPDQPDDVVFTPKIGAGWEIAMNWQSNKNASFMAYNMVLAQLPLGAMTMTGHWPSSALLWGGWWSNDGVPVVVGLFSNVPEDDGKDAYTHHGWVRLSINPDDSLTLYDWAYESQHDMPIIAGAVPEPEYWMLVLASLTFLILFRRNRTHNTP